MSIFIESNDEDQFAIGQSSRDLRVSSDATEPETQLDVGGPGKRTDSSDRLEALRKNSAEDSNHRIELADGADAIHQAYGLIGSLMTQQATMLAFMDCFHLLAIVVLVGLPLAFLIRRFEIGKAAGAAH